MLSCRACSTPLIGVCAEIVTTGAMKAAATAVSKTFRKSATGMWCLYRRGLHVLSDNRARVWSQPLEAARHPLPITIVNHETLIGPHLHIKVLRLLFALACLPSGLTAQASSPKAVLVTGASSGIGRKITERLSTKGLFVYAGARSQKDINELNAMKSFEAVERDITVPRDISAAVETVKKGGRGLYGVVNNAGIAVVAPLVEVSDKDMN